MSEEIIFLGSGGGRIVLSTQIVGTGGFVIKAADYQIWVDPGEGALVRAHNKVKASDTDILYVTHHHLDHANDVNAVIDAMTIGGERKKGVLIGTETVVHGKDNESPSVSNFYKSFLQEFYPVKPGDKVKIGDLTFEATPTKHDCEANGLKLHTPTRVIGYTGNTSPFPELTEFFQNCDVLIVDVLRPGEERWPTHFCSTDAVEFFKATKPKLGIISHFGLKALRANPVWEARDIANKSGVKVFAAREGLKVDLKSLFVS
ncbi:MAG TPA: MBL fold metallo-hydrolase [Candidatus Nanoarchaeia archaeon]|nr:MBL fold metallo-hydrolase [Candidatus Nanoarchaeia archaeon]